MTCHTSIIPISSRASRLQNALRAIKDAKAAGVELHIIAESLSVQHDETARRDAANYAALLQGLLTGAIQDIERAMK